MVLCPVVDVIDSIKVSIERFGFDKVSNCCIGFGEDDDGCLIIHYYLLDEDDVSSVSSSLN